ncbi:MAG: acyl-CoA dehydrogenase [Firmicutes bacterium]|jgi:alkylation response protein AidB-like acyl-CoA dehydrogenase|nr:acyl-CoA dehydrogenase [Bacillota bacterium]HPU02084.1 acyl-CoA dehydrogenase family protein [Bacillota bacterium]
MSELIKGGAFLLGPVDEKTVFTPEDFDEIHLMIKNTVLDFIENEVVPKTEEIEEKKEGVTVGLLRKAGELGLLSSDIPEEYGGEEADKITTMLITECVSGGGSFATAFGAHTGIGTLPIVFFGTEEQKKKYLPGLATGELIAAYALTEPEAGSDALNCKTVATLSEDGKYYILNGEKTFITNAAWADVIITYAKIDGERFTAFIVDANSEGVTLGPEEKKMGIHGSSTRSVILENVKVPVENMLWKEGKGHQVAFNILNIGRFKLGAGCVGGCKRGLESAVDYALQRIQFKQPIANFNLTKYKIAQMALLIYTTESLVYRLGGMIDKKLEEVVAAGEDSSKIVEAIQEYAIECSIAKVYCSEALDYVVDEAVQIYGGYGYCQEYPVERAYRDSRINRIFEGTNEINRMLIPGTLMRKALKGELPFMDAVFGLGEELKKLREAEEPAESPDREDFILNKMKKLFLMAAGNAAQKFSEALTNEQEILVRLADIAMEIFAVESALLRTKKIIASQGKEAARLPLFMTQVLVNDMVPKLETWAKEILAGTLEGETLEKTLKGLSILTSTRPINTYALRREIADAVYEAKKFFLDRR